MAVPPAAKSAWTDGAVQTSDSGAPPKGHGTLGAESCAPPNAVLPMRLVEYEVGESGLGCVVVDERVDTDTFTSLSARQARVHTGTAPLIDPAHTDNPAEGLTRAEGTRQENVVAGGTHTM
ncbi:hypothetical protein B2J93_1368 [Marssonina coronariae]|uniref:Uncharacterized protein n=1 Tax=Diplocarpon coronariae TaxID=2795749 RepID=A0A218Z8V8_9HELO|nr:hypothetical protein B2J93_1368 [Marssonina coronariae]